MQTRCCVAVQTGISRLHFCAQGRRRSWPARCQSTTARQVRRCCATAFPAFGTRPTVACALAVHYILAASLSAQQTCPHELLVAAAKMSLHLTQRVHSTCQCSNCFIQCLHLQAHSRQAAALTGNYAHGRGFADDSWLAAPDEALTGGTVSAVGASAACSARAQAHAFSTMFAKTSFVSMNAMVCCALALIASRADTHRLQACVTLCARVVQTRATVQSLCL